MRTLEWVLLALNLLTLLGVLLPRQSRPRAQAFIPAMTFLVMIVHLLLEGYRWQMMPTYLLTLMLATISIPAMMGGYSRKKASTGMRVFGLSSMVLGLLLWAAAALPPYLLPVFELPEPSGPYAVGTTSFHMVDTSREETLTPEPGDQRALMVTAWYPSNEVDGPKTPYLRRANVTGSMLSRALGLPSYTFTYLNLVHTHAVYNAPAAADGPFPVILYSHGYMPGFGGQNTIQLEELASHGYVVFAIHHPYESAAVLFPDRGVVPGDRERMKDMQSERGVTRLLNAYLRAEPDLKLEVARSYFATMPLLRETLDRWTEDAFFVLGRLSDIESGAERSVQWRPGRSSTVNGPNPLAGKLDMSRMGMFGMDMGGMVAGQVCLMSDAIDAGLNYDGLQFGDITELQRDTPFMILNATITRGLSDPLIAAAFEPAYSGSIAETRQNNFSDFSVVSDFFRGTPLLGKIDGDQMARLLSDITVQYFDHYVKYDREEPFAYQAPGLELNQLTSAASADPEEGAPSTDESSENESADDNGDEP